MLCVPHYRSKREGLAEISVAYGSSHVPHVSIAGSVEEMDDEPSQAFRDYGMSKIESDSGDLASSGLFEEELRRGREALERQDLSAASVYLRRAHAIGHHVLSQHLASHRSLLLLGWARKSIADMCTELFSIVALAVVGCFVGQSHNHRESGR